MSRHAETRKIDRKRRVHRGRPAGRLLGAAVAVVASSLLAATVAQANQMTVFSCHDPAGKAVGHAGWVIERTGQPYMTAADSCGAEGRGALSLELAANGAGYPNGALIQWSFHAPSWATIANYTAQIADSYARPGSSGIGQGQVFFDASDESDPVYDYRNLGGGNWGASTIERSPPAPVSFVTVNASCDGQEGSCPAGVEISRVDMTSATLLLDDSATPTVNSLSGNLTAAGTLRGQAEASFQAQEEGPGIYSAWLTVDGKAQPPVLVNSNNGLCVSLGETSDGTRSFTTPTPCAKTTSGAVNLNTAELPDGSHTVKLQVDDAAGNATTAFDGTIRTDNAPEDSSAPTIITPSQVSVGSALSSRPGEWSAPEGAGSITYTYQWQDCNSTGQECTATTGATSASYTPAPSDVGHTLRLAVTAADNDGASTETSAATPLVGAAAGSLGAQPGPGASPSSPAGGGGTPAGGSPATGASRSAAAAANAPVKAVLRLGVHHRIIRTFARRAIKRLNGRLLDASGHPISHARLVVLERTGPHGKLRVIGHTTTGARGAFRAHVPPGPSRMIEVAYHATAKETGYAATAKVHETVRAGVKLHINPRSTSRTGTILLKGRVLGKIPRQGVQVDLLVHYRGRWEPFRTTRTDSNGRFTVAYQFQGALGRFPFRAVVPASQARFAFARGVSETINVQTR